MARFLLTAAIFTISINAVTADDWPQWLGPRRDGTSLEKGLLDAFPKDGLKRLWEREVGEGFSGPVIAADKLILYHRVDNDEVVECLNATTGKSVWKAVRPTNYQDPYNKGNGPRSTPVITGDKVVTLGADGMLQCLSLDGGKKIWARPIAEEYKAPLGFFGVGTSPIVEQNLILVNVGGKQAGIVAFDLASGKEAWKATNDPASYSSPIVCTVNGARLAVFFTRTGAVILEPKAGKLLYQQRWRSRNDLSVNAATPLVIGDLAFFSTSYDTGALLLKLKKNGAEEVWTDEKVMSNHYNTCIHHDGHLYGFDGRQDSRIAPSFRCIELKSRKVKWEQEEFGNGTMVRADGKLIVLTEKGDLHLVKATPEKFTELAKTRLLEAGPCRAQIALAHGRLYARDQKKLVCVELKK